MNVPSFRQPGHLRASKWSAPLLAWGSTPLLACAAAMFLGACSSAPTHYHSLTPIHQAIGPPPQSDGGTIACTSDATGPDATSPNTPEREPTDTVLLAHLAVPVEADRMQLLLHQTPTRLSVYETERWAAPLGDQISFILIDDLRNALPDLNITSDPLLIGTATPLQLNMEIEELDALAGKEAIVRARWKLFVTGNTASQTGTCAARQPLHTPNLDELVLAWSRSLSDISARLAASVQHWGR